MINHQTINKPPRERESKLKSPRFLFTILTSLITGLLVAGIVMAWTNPTANPPSGGGALYYYNGSVGIGTTAPGLKLDILGTYGLPASSGTSQTGVTRLQASGTTVVLDMGIYQTSPYGGWLQATDRTDLSVKFPLLLNPNGGNVGIGTTTPSQRLDLGGGTVGDGNVGGSIKIGGGAFGSSGSCILSAYSASTCPDGWTAVIAGLCVKCQ